MHLRGVLILHQFNEWRVLSQQNIRTIVQPENNLYVIAENDESAYIVISANDCSGTLVLVNFANGQEKPIGTSIMPTLMEERT